MKSSSSAMTDKVRELESKLKDLSAAEEGGLIKTPRYVKISQRRTMLKIRKEKRN